MMCKRGVCMEQSSKRQPQSPILLGIMCFFAYTICYDGRSILSAILPAMTEVSAFDKESLGLMGSAFFLTYGIGQIINGLIGDHVRARYMVSIGLLGAGVSLLCIPVISSGTLGIFLWGICGLLLSMLWGPLSKVIAENVPSNRARYYMTGLTVASILGTMAASLIATAASARQKWQAAFYISGILLIVCAAAWFVVLGYLEKQQIVRPIQKKEKENRGMGREVFSILWKNAILPMAFAAIVNGIIRNAVAFWIPTYIAEKLMMSSTVAAGLSSILPIVNLAGTFTGLFLFKKMKCREMRVCIIMFSFATVMFVAMWLMDGRYVLPTILALFAASAAMSSVCNMLFSAYCMRFRDTGAVSSISGFLNFTSYASSSIASAVFSSVVTSSGWNTTVLIWAGLTIAGGAASIWALVFTKRYHTDRPALDTEG